MSATTESTGRRVLDALRRDPLAVGGTIVLVLLVVVGVAGPWLAPAGVNDVDVDQMLRPPSGAHPFGTDELGRDVLSRVLVAARVSLQVGAVSVGIALVAGVTLGLLAGYYRGWLDSILMRCMDVLFAFPVLLLAVAIVAVLGPGLLTAMVAIGVVYTPIFARITRAGVLSVREQVFVRAAVSIGASDLRIMRRHVLPNIAAPLIVQTSLSLAFAILSEAALSFLGLGIQPPAPAWGRMLFDGRGFVTDAWWLGVFPGAAIFLTVLAFNLVGDALRDVLDPRQLTLAEARRSTP
ncbi:MULTISPECIES: ABC transporter permease [Micromonospora]|uniref:ABC transporter permease n=1 Tax=Micromonospora chalcea TaxID=1874 RepID=A0ABX9Y322_MICCH|nr:MULTISPECIES: ABC transporter permease [Micromonospora]EWM63770.1 oligopeptide/dipeptide ABC transporter permease [Micromonospora sp. M42]MBC8990101.1 ABC transporter permease [Micromonospora chalcea]MBP1783377.1 peptide/nickel transport system permease protein [Micromonospora sp. HB375]MBQ1065911.1 ABC transporter permease [Micromonospora sp. D75]MCK1807045.1 ABC transporter permease [Micromonospora sp. R42106]